MEDFLPGGIGPKPQMLSHDNPGYNHPGLALAAQCIFFLTPIFDINIQMHALQWMCQNRRGLFRRQAAERDGRADLYARPLYVRAFILTARDFKRILRKPLLFLKPGLLYNDSNDRREDRKALYDEQRRISSGALCAVKQPPAPAGAGQCDEVLRGVL